VFGGWWWWRCAQRASDARLAATLEAWGDGFERRLHDDLRAASREAAGEASRASARETERELRAVLDASERELRAVLDASERELRALLESTARETRAELAQTLALMQQALLHHAGDVARTQNEQIDTFRTQLAATQAALAQGLQSATSNLVAQSQAARDAQDASLKRFSDSLQAQLTVIAEGQGRQLAEVRQGVEARLVALQEGNEKRLEQMRLTVDEKLQATLETRLGESFRQVAERLEQVHKGLGEMQGLARDVGALNRVMTNVRTRGTFGEVQLAAMLEQVFTPDQYAANVETVPGTNARVEFAVKLPGARADGLPVWLPIDAKFPREDYDRLLEAQERADPVAAEAAARALEKRILLEAQKIREKYVAPPHTTDVAILFVPTEGLYAEALRRPGLVEALHREHRVSLCGPTTLHATLTSLQMGFRTLALEKRSAEVWDVLGAVKTEFGKFGVVLEKTKRKLDEAQKSIDDAEVRTRVMTRRLKSVEALPEERTSALLGAGVASAELDFDAADEGQA
jgi:DNA recombination protein RmuC